ncbi:hypothetical protein HS088_TW14G00518 [Tripterygium wilfordii]|uniref:Uncharacterized protein n=1 Tax=Tripterygium wilfordii TaxID=458696 RepID=A0A7J7CR71_TRIWF|nr:hypothetical protein HS088_TW14G00518 [Tripterygium wilfordii]
MDPRFCKAWQAAETEFLNLKEAIETPPEKLNATALVPDLSPFPANRFMATFFTPPIEGYIEKLMEAGRRALGRRISDD